MKPNRNVSNTLMHRRTFASNHISEVRRYHIFWLGWWGCTLLSRHPHRWLQPMEDLSWVEPQLPLIFDWKIGPPHWSDPHTHIYLFGPDQWRSGPKHKGGSPVGLCYVSKTIFLLDHIHTVKEPYQIVSSVNINRSRACEPFLIVDRLRVSDTFTINSSRASELLMVRI